MQIVGASFSSPAANEAWAQDQGYQFELWTDDDKTLALHYGAISTPGTPFPERVTKLLDADGVLILEYVSGFVIQDHPNNVLADCQALFGN